MLAAACLYALDHHVDRLAEDHENARVLADGLAELGLDVDAARHEHRHRVGAGRARRWSGELWDAGVQVTPLAPDRVRCVTHLDVDRAGIERALAAFREVLR